MKLTRLFRPASVLFAAALAAVFICVACGASKKSPPPPQPAKPQRQTAEDKRQQNKIYHYEQGLLHFREGRFPESEKEFRESLRYGKDHVASYYGLGLALMQQDRFKEALPEFEQALKLSPDYWDALLMKGVCQDKMGQPELAMETYKIGLQSRAPSVVGMANFYIGQIQLRNGEHEKAYYSFARAVTDVPDYVPAYARAAETLEAVGKNSEALELYEQALAKSPQSAEYNYKAGMVNFRLNRIPEARRLLERALSIAPNSDYGQKAFEMLKIIPKT